MRSLMIAVMVLAVAVAGASVWFAYRTTVDVLGVQQLGVDFAIVQRESEKLPVGINVDTDAVHLSNMPPGGGCSWRDVTITNRYGVAAKVKVAFKELDAWVVAKPDSFILPPDGQGTTRVEACPPADASFGSRSGTFLATFTRAD